MRSKKIDEATNTITSSNKFLHELKRIVINIVTYVVLGFIVYENRAVLIDQATKTVIHNEVVEEVDHLPHLDVKAWKKEKKKMLKKIDNQNELIKNIKHTYNNNDSIRVDEAYRRLDILLDRINKL